MSSVGKRLTFIVAGLAVVVTVITTVVSVIDFAPDGVPLARRAEYEAKLTHIRLMNSAPESTTRRSLPIVTIEERHFNFGRMNPHTTASHGFTIENRGSKDLLLESAGTSCKCTVSHIDGRVVKPGDSTRATVTWNTGYQAEGYEQTAIIKTNDPVNPELELIVRGTVRGELMLGVETLAMPSSDIGKLAASSTFLYSQLWEDFRIESATSDLPGFQWSTEPLANEDLPVADLEAVSAWRLNVMIIGQQVGNYKGTVKLKVVRSSGGDAVERELAVEGRVRSPIAFIGDDLNAEKGLELGLIQRGKAFNRSLVVRVRDGSSRKIAILDVQPQNVQATLEPMKQPGAYRLKLSVPADSDVELFNREDKHGFVQVGDPKDRSFHNWLPLYGAIINPPENR